MARSTLQVRRPMSTPRPLVVPLVCALVLAGCGTASPTPAPSAPMSPTAEPPSPSPSAAAPSLSPSGPPTVPLAEVATLRLELGGGPDWPTGLDGSVWILAPDDAEPFVYRLDPATGEEQARVAVGGRRLCQGMAAAFGALWVCTDGGMARIDPATNAVAARIAYTTPQAFARPVAGEDAIWSVAGNVVATQVARIDPATNAVTATYELGHEVASLAYGDGALWATAPADGLLLRIDPASGEVAVHAEDLPGATAVGFGAGSLWVGLYGNRDGAAAAGEPVVVRVATGDAAERAGIDIGTTTTVDGDIWAGDDAVWVRSVGDPFLLRIDPSSNLVDLAVAGFQSGGAVTVVDGSVWTTSFELQAVFRIDP